MLVGVDDADACALPVSIVEVEGARWCLGVVGLRWVVWEP